MTRRSPRENDQPGHDSFLDIVSNIVGILIILVMVTGVRAKNDLPVDGPPGGGTAIAALAGQLEAERARLDQWRSEALQQSRQVDEIEELVKVRDRERLLLATAAEALARKLAERRGRLDAEAQAQFDRSRELAATQAELDRLASAQLQLEAAKPAAILVEALPTPLGQTVHGDEAHFQLSGGRIIWIPLTQLLEEFKTDARSKASQLLSMPELTDTIGPYGGFRLRYTLQRRQMSPEMAMAAGGGPFAQLRQWTLIPTSNELGEPVDEALREGSRFRAVVRGLPRTTTITIWTYEDSFDAFRRIKQELFALGFDTAARPLPLGVPISGSPSGSKSSAQ
ncbi:MAG: hypothetical protein GXY25_11370 [Pirellulaceae bacterium]|jgi:hypothetical protein|nr:hypothetical protein [Thermoguttaceae bacterium]MDI9446376.1 hypothetical protein [Planctomycetota bacterium]NLZ01129.1 hypothetical protein [Pirellulaceae bacterium]